MMRSFYAGVVLEELRELVLEGFDLGAIADQDVRIVRIVESVVLGVGLSVVKAFEWTNLGDEGLGKCMGGVKLRDIGLGKAALVVIFVEDGRTVGRANVGTLAIELGGVVSNREKDAQKLAVGDDGGVVDHLDGFGVAG